MEHIGKQSLEYIVRTYQNYSLENFLNGCSLNSVYVVDICLLMGYSDIYYGLERAIHTDSFDVLLYFINKKYFRKEYIYNIAKKVKNIGVCMTHIIVNNLVDLNVLLKATIKENSCIPLYLIEKGYGDFQCLFACCEQRTDLVLPLLKKFGEEEYKQIFFLSCSLGNDLIEKMIHNVNNDVAIDGYKTCLRFSNSKFFDIFYNKLGDKIFTEEISFLLCESKCIALIRKYNDKLDIKGCVSSQSEEIFSIFYNRIVDRKYFLAECIKYNFIYGFNKLKDAMDNDMIDMCCKYKRLHFLTDFTKACQYFSYNECSLFVKN